MSYFPSPWSQIGDDLKDIFDTEILTHEGYDADNFLDKLVPSVDEDGKFFGTNILNVFIAQRAYGWKICGSADQREFEWPPPGFEDARTRYLNNIDRWPSYQTLIWVDFWTATQNVSYNPGSDWASMMEQTDAAIQDFCANTPGFTYMGRIESQVEAGFFEETIRNHFGTRPYKT